MRFLLVPLVALAAAAQPAQAPPTLDELLDTYRRDPKQRATLAWRIGVEKKPRARTFLIAQLPDERASSVRAALLRALSHYPDAEVLALYDRTLEGDGPYAEKAAALYALPKFPIDWRGRVLAFLEEEDDPTLRRAGYQVIGRGKDDRSLKILERALTRARDDRSRVAVLAALPGNFPAERVYARFLRPYLDRRASPTLRQEALRVLGAAKDPRFHAHARALVEKEDGTWRLGQWITWAGAFADDEALETILAIVGEAGDAVGSHVTRTLPGLDGPKTREWVVAKGLRHGEPSVRRGALEWLRRRPLDAARKPLLSLAKGRDVGLARGAVETLGAFAGEDVRKVLRRLWSARDPALAAEAVRSSYAVEKGEEDVVSDVLKVALRSRSFELRITAMELLRERHAPRAVEALRKNAGHERPQVRSAAYEALTWLRVPETVDFLLKRLDRERGRTLHDLVDALVDLTGFDYGRNTRNWRDWWERSRAAYELPPKPEVRKRSAPPAGYATYYGIAVRSDRVAFVIDISGSMAARGTGISKIQRAKDNLVAVLGAFRSHVRFGIVAFHTSLVPYGDVLERATSANRKKATDWVQALRATGGTNVYDALMMAMDLKDVDTIFLLSDGAPSAGEFTDTAEIVRRVVRKNRFRRIRINTIGIQVAGATAKFMQELAERNFGEFVAR